jgi:hypothetical protein
MKAEYIRADKSRLLHSSLAKRRRTIHSEYAVIRSRSFKVEVEPSAAASRRWYYGLQPMTTSVTDFNHYTNRTAGWAAVAGGIFGLAALAFIVAALFIRSDSKRFGALMFRGHDAMATLQTLCMFAVVAALYSLANRRQRPMPKLAHRLANAALVALVLALLLTLAHVLNDMLYMIPQGFFGLWMIWLSRYLSDLLPGHVKWLGIVAGSGLTLIGIFPIAFGVLVDPIVFGGPMPSDYKDVNSTANLVVHIMLAMGTLIGLPLYPLWSLAVGRTLLRQAS